MVVVSVEGQEFYLDGQLKSNLDLAKKEIKEDWDMIFGVDGMEGAGKSTIAIQMAYYCDPTLTLDRIVFSPSFFRKAIVEAQPFQAVVYDEAYTGLASRSAMSYINKALITMISEIRQKNLFVFVVMPSFFELDRYMAIHRTRALIHVYAKMFKRGRFLFFNHEKKRSLWINGKKTYSYSKPKSNFYGRFTKAFPLDVDEYKKKKRSALHEREIKAAHVEHLKEVEEQLFAKLMEHGEGLPHSTKMEILGMARATYYVKLRNWRAQQV